MNAAAREDQLKDTEHRVTQLEKDLARESRGADRLHAELQECCERFHELVDHLHQVFWIVEAKTDRLLYVSPAYEKIWGRTCQSRYGNNQSWMDAVHPDDRERVLSVLVKKHDTGWYEIEFRIMRPDGSTRWIWDRGYAARDEQGDIKRFVGIAEDITDRKKAEEQSARLAAIIESADDAIVSLTLNGIVIGWNQGAERLYGYSAEEMIGRSITILHPPDQHEEYLAMMAKAKKGEPVAAFGTVRRRKDGTLIDVSLSASAIEVQPGHITGTTKIFHDISKIKRLEEQFRQAQKMEAVGQLAGGVAHDFNNLLTVISGYSEVLLSRLPATDPAHGMLQEIHKAGERAAGLTRQLLAFSRKQIIQPKVLDLNALANDVGKMLRHLIGEDVSLTTVLAPRLGRVKADPGQIEQVLMNLAVNARDAMPEGGKLTIETANVDLDESYSRSHAEVKPGSYVMLAVNDTGCGMTEEVKARIFEPFFTTKEPGKGTGLGLATVYGIVKQSGGYVYVYSEPGHGTTFKIYLPLVEDGIPSGNPHLDSKPMPKGSETILLVEDEDAVRSLTRYTLQMQGYAVLEAKDGEEALRVAEKHQGGFALLLTDVVMPRMGGRRLAERLAQVQPGLKVLFLSGYTDDAVVRHGVLEAEVAFLQKPFTPSALAEKVRNVLDH